LTANDLGMVASAAAPMVSIRRVENCAEELVDGPILPASKRRPRNDGPRRAVRNAFAAAVAQAFADDELPLGFEDGTPWAHELADAAVHAVGADDVALRVATLGGDRPRVMGPVALVIAVPHSRTLQLAANSVGTAAASLKNAWNDWLNR